MTGTTPSTSTQRSGTLRPPTTEVRQTGTYWDLEEQRSSNLLGGPDTGPTSDSLATGVREGPTAFTRSGFDLTRNSDPKPGRANRMRGDLNRGPGTRGSSGPYTSETQVRSNVSDRLSGDSGTRCSSGPHTSACGDTRDFRTSPQRTLGHVSTWDPYRTRSSRSKRNLDTRHLRTSYPN